MAQTETNDESNSSNAVAAAADALLQLPSKLDAHAKKNTANEASRGRSKANNNGAPTSSRLPSWTWTYCRQTCSRQTCWGTRSRRQRQPRCTSDIHRTEFFCFCKGECSKEISPSSQCVFVFSCGYTKSSWAFGDNYEDNSTQVSEWWQKQAKKQSKGPRIKRGARFKVKRDKLKLAIKADQRPEAWGIIEQYTRREDPAFARWRTEDQVSLKFWNARWRKQKTYLFPVPSVSISRSTR